MEELREENEGREGKERRGVLKRRGKEEKEGEKERRGIDTQGLYLYYYKLAEEENAGKHV